MSNSTCGKSIITSLKLIFQTALIEGVFPENWKKSNIVPTNKKENKKLIKNYRPINLLPIFSKIYERFVFSASFSCFIWDSLNVNLDSYQAIHAFLSCCQ